jgi:hypothetical protein
MGRKLREWRQTHQSGSPPGDGHLHIASTRHRFEDEDDDEYEDDWQFALTVVRKARPFQHADRAGLEQHVRNVVNQARNPINSGSSSSTQARARRDIG